MEIKFDGKRALVTGAGKGVCIELSDTSLLCQCQSLITLDQSLCYAKGCKLHNNSASG